MLRTYGGIDGQRRRAERRAKLMAAATHLFGTAGYAATTMKGICVEAGLTQRYFYESFANTEDLLCEVFLLESKRIRGKLLAAIQTAKTDPLSRIHAVLETYFQGLAARPDIARLLLIESPGVCARCDELYRQEMLKSAEQMITHVCPELPLEPANGLLPRLLVSGFLGAIYQLVHEWLLADFADPPETLVRNCLALFQGMIAQWQSTSDAGGVPSNGISKSANKISMSDGTTKNLGKYRRPPVGATSLFPLPATTMA
jgi:AcrR family transcriptional regulator